jgi:tRNA A37 methylthiotransferase MiaB
MTFQTAFSAQPGDFVEIEITSAQQYDLVARVVS